MGYISMLMSRRAKNKVRLRLGFGVAILAVIATVGVFSSNTPTVRAAQTVPYKINFQGRLTDSAGNAMANGDYNVKFRLYDAATAGTVLWTETRETTNRVTVTNGLFSVQLGDVTALSPSVFTQHPLYFEVELPTPATATCSTAACATFNGTEIMSPRRPLGASPYAMNSDTLDGVDGASFARRDESNTFTGNSQIFKNGADSTAAFQIQNAAGAAMMTVDTTNNSIKLPTGTKLALNGSDSAYLIHQNTNVLQLSNVSPNGGIQIQGDSFIVQDTTGYNNNLYMDNTGMTTFQNRVNSTTAFRVRDSAGTAALTVDTTNLRVTMADTVIAAGKTLSITGGTTASRPASPTEGMMFYDTDTKRMLVYSNGKWQADRSTATKIVAANDSQNKDGADFVVSSADETAGNADAAIQAAIAALPATGGSVYLMEGTYTIDTAISLPNNTTLSGAGASSIIKVKGALNVDIRAITNPNAGLLGNTRITIRDLRLDGNKSNNTAGIQEGIYMARVSNTSGDVGASISNVEVANFRSNGIYLANSNNTRITQVRSMNNTLNGVYINQSPNTSVTDSILQSNGDRGIESFGVGSMTIANNDIRSNTSIGLHVYDGNSNVTGNRIIGNGGSGIAAYDAEDSTFTGNTINTNGGHGIQFRTGSQNIVSGNKIHDNGGTGSSSGIAFLFGSNNRYTITGNDITDTAGTGYALDINSASSNNVGTYVADNRISGTFTSFFRDLSGSTIYANQLDASGKLINSASGGLATKLQSGSTNDLFQALAADGTTKLFGISSAGDVSVRPADSTSAFVITKNSDSSALFTADTTNSVVKVGTTGSATLAGVKLLSTSAEFSGTVRIGDATNGIDISSTGVTIRGSARPTRTITLAAEYPSATFTADGTSNDGSLSSDFCSPTSLLNRNATLCDGATVRAHNYYKWTSTQATAQDYDIFIRYQLPSDYDTGSMTDLTFFARAGDATADIANLAMYTDAGSTACVTTADAASVANSWQSVVAAAPLGACSLAAGDYVTFKIQLTTTSASTTGVLSGDVSFKYRSRF